MTKVEIISGFLGAGKTTLIKKLIQEVFQGQKLVLIENEFGEIGVTTFCLQPHAHKCEAVAYFIDIYIIPSSNSRGIYSTKIGVSCLIFILLMCYSVGSNRIYEI